ARTKGSGLVVTSRARGSYEGCEFTRCEGPAVLATESAAPALTRTVVRDCVASAAVLLTGESAAELDRLEVTAAAGIGLRIRAGANPLVRRARIVAAAGHGVEVAQGGRGRLEDCVVEKAGGASLRISADSRTHVVDCSLDEA
ncbi:right-handed parallel beta-helix repeat-containing protein, partial [Streptomyces sp. SID7982]|nr:right-handed parallel beta-helix repeat-containing protein [Streptomyces sp. SID7982]